MHYAAILIKASLNAIEISQIVGIITTKNSISNVIGEYCRGVEFNLRWGLRINFASNFVQLM